MVWIDGEGRIVFELEDPRAEKVEIVGEFQGWHEQRLPMVNNGEGRWKLVIDPGPGLYLFRYLIDSNQWKLDDQAHGIMPSVDGVQKCRVYRPENDSLIDVAAA